MRRFSKQLKDIAKNVQNGSRTAFRGVINLVKSKPPHQLMQVSGLSGEVLHDVELMQHFGFTSVPPVGTQAVVIPLGGKTTHGIVVATENGAFRVVGLESGEVAVYDESGSTIILKKGRVVEVDCDQFKVKCKSYSVEATDGANFNTPKLETNRVFTAQGQINGNGGMAVQGGEGATFSGNITQQGGNYTTEGDVVASGKSLVTHTHNEQGDGGPTSAPL
ncbi:phage baseplate assembly protein V [Histophilus somni]|uniref:Phage baseplate assembly protein V n=2 Tax=Histophilus somni TaxID=731 RepID=A0A9Q6KA56_HISSO|nr:phage baseplate assembly protein V [Histophilus somni]ARU65490.1 baseplate assembly protein [Histophilus somni]ARU67358.1 baseplate assembly protein [Histophilus somni]ARU69238.1 baseplate assembly protein [Histophilus somni]ARU71115.1 baseplate assembly protein [Histophilus somni]ARU72986.1 baseplate assembly protein [Histophilus somni]